MNVSRQRASRLSASLAGLATATLTVAVLGAYGCGTNGATDCGAGNTASVGTGTGTGSDGTNGTLRGMTTAIAQQYGTDTSSSADPQVFTDADNAKYTNVTLKNITVSGAGIYGILATDLGTGNRGTVNFDTVSVTGSTLGALSMDGAPSTLITKVGSTNSGW